MPANLRNIEVTKHSVNGISSHFLITVSFDNGIQSSSEVKVNSTAPDILQSIDDLYLDIQNNDDLDMI